MKPYTLYKRFIPIVLLFVITIGCDESISPEKKNEDLPLSIESITPTDGSTGIDPETDVIVKFNKPIALSTVSNNTFWLSNTSLTTNEYGTITQSGSTATLKLNNPLLEGATYELGLTTGIATVSGEALDKDYLISFTTKVPDDSQPPFVNNYSISDDYQFVPTDGEIEINFSETLEESSVSGISLKDTDNGKTVDVDISVNGSKVTVSPKEDLYGNHNHELTVPASIQDLAGNQMGAESTLSFGTKNSDFTVSSFYPEDGATNVKIDETIKITFEREIDPSTVDAETIRIIQSDPDGNGYEDLAGTLGVDGAVVEFIPNEPLREFNNAYSILVYGVKDIKNNVSDTPDATFNTVKVSTDHYYFIRAYYDDDSYLTYDPHQFNLFMSYAFINHDEKKWKFEKNGDDTHGIISKYKGDSHAIASNTPDDGVEIFLGARPNNSQWYSDQTWVIGFEHTGSASKATFTYENSSGPRFFYLTMDVSNDFRLDEENYFMLVRAEEVP